MIVFPSSLGSVPPSHEINATASKPIIKNVKSFFILFFLFMEESFGKVTAEALSCGVPVIVPDTTANPELVTEGSGYVFEKFDIDKIINYTDEIYKKGKEFYIKNLMMDYQIKQMKINLVLNTVI